MPIEYKDRVRDTTSSTGTGNLVLDGVAPVGYQTFAAAHPFNIFYYCIVDEATGDWETGRGRITGGAMMRNNALNECNVLASSNAGAAVNFAAGEKIVFSCYPAKAMPQGKFVVSTSAPTASDNIANDGVEPESSLWFYINPYGTLDIYRMTSEASPTATWANVGNISSKQVGSLSQAYILGASSKTLDLVDSGGVAAAYEAVIAGKNGVAHNDGSLVVGHGVNYTESGAGYHQTELLGAAVMTVNTTPNTATLFKVRPQGSAIFDVHIVAVFDGGYKAWTGKALIVRGTTATAVTMVDGVLTSMGDSGGAATGLAASLSAGPTATNSGLAVSVTGLGVAVHWTIAARVSASHYAAYAP